MTSLHELVHDLRLALRAFRREPMFVAGVVLTFALAIGANAAMFGLLQRLMLAPPPGIHDAARVVRVALRYAGEQGSAFRTSTTSYPVFQALVSLGSAFSAVAAVRADTMTTGRGADLSEVAVVQASGHYFTALGVRPALGRVFGPNDDELPSGADVVVLSHAYWQRRFGGAPSAIGSQLLVDDQLLTIIGVAPREFNGTELSATDLFIPLTTASRKQGAGWWNQPSMRVVSVLARLRDGVTASAAGEMAVLALRETSAPADGDRLASVPLESLIPGQSARESPQSRIALWLSGVALVVLLIATANISTLMLLRAVRRRRDVAMRVALGAGWSRLARQTLAESVLLALVGAGVGLLLSRWFGDIIRVTLLPNVAATDVVVDAHVLLGSIAAATGAGLLAGLSPLARLGRQNVVHELRAGVGAGSSGRFAIQHTLVALQVALCMILLIGAGLFVRSLRRVQSQDLGFSTARLLQVSLDFRGALDGHERDLAHEEAVRRIESVPGVTGATTVAGMPFSSHFIPPINIPGYAMPPGTVQQLPILYGATPAYLDMMGVTLREGRLFTEQDGRAAPSVLLVNETLARTAWPGQTAIGKCVRAGFAASLEGDPEVMVATLPCREVVGVVRDSRARSLRLEGSEDKLMQYYVPMAQFPSPPMPDIPSVHGILVRTTGEPREMITSVQRIIQATSAVPVYARVRPYQDLIDPQLRSRRLGATLFSAFGALALGIAAVGLFAVISYLVTQRTQEIGVRLALGGSEGRVARLIVRDALRMTGGGAIAGGVVAMAGAPLIEPMLFQTSAREPTTVIGAVLILMALSLGAAAVPAWRASRISPMTALRSDG